MIWRKDIYDSLTNCAALCDKFATECSRSEATEGQYHQIFLSLDCADLCRQLAMLYVRGAESTPLIVRACLDVCRKCAQEVNKSDAQNCRELYALCQQTILSCVSILDMAHHSDLFHTPAVTPASPFYGIDLNEIRYN